MILKRCFCLQISIVCCVTNAPYLFLSAGVAYPPLRRWSGQLFRCRRRAIVVVVLVVSCVATSTCS